MHLDPDLRHATLVPENDLFGPRVTHLDNEDYAKLMAGKFSTANTSSSIFWGVTGQQHSTVIPSLPPSLSTANISEDSKETMLSENSGSGFRELTAASWKGFQRKSYR